MDEMARKAVKVAVDEQALEMEMFEQQMMAEKSNAKLL